MLTYKYLDTTNGELVFAYYPNGNKVAPGKVAISGTRQGRVIEESKEDFGNRYAYHAIHGIDVTKESGTVAWY
jgi:hypothetical protein